MASLTLTQAREAILARWSAEWGATPLWATDNESFDPGNEVGAGDTWARIVVRDLPGGQETMGKVTSRRYRRKGMILIQLFATVDEGVAELDTLAQTARGIFEGTSFSGIDANNGEVRQIGSDGRWYQFVVEVLFDYDEIK